MNTNRICNQRVGALNDADRLELAKLLIKAWYTVRVGKEKQLDKKPSTYCHFVEYWEG